MTNRPSSTILVMDGDLVMAFVATFARLEYALKRSGLAQGSIERVGPDWKRFERRLARRSELWETGAAASALAYFTQQPPEIQILCDGALGWRHQPRADDDDVTLFVARCVRTLRNNLFHGRKFPHDAVDERARNERLLEHALDALDVLPRADPDVWRAFQSPT